MAGQWIEMVTVLLLIHTCLPEAIELELPSCQSAADYRSRFLCEMPGKLEDFERRMKELTDDLLDQFDDDIYVKVNGKYERDQTPATNGISYDWRKQKKPTSDVDRQFLILAGIEVPTDMNPMNLKLARISGNSVLYRNMNFLEFYKNGDCDITCQKKINSSMNLQYNRLPRATDKVHTELQALYGKKGQLIQRQAMQRRTLLYMHSHFVPCTTNSHSRGECAGDMVAFEAMQKIESTMQQFFMVSYQFVYSSSSAVGVKSNECLSQLYLKKAGIITMQYSSDFEGEFTSLTVVDTNYINYLFKPHFQPFPRIQNHLSTPAPSYLLPLCLVQGDFDLVGYLTSTQRPSMQLILQGLRYCDPLCSVLERNSMVFSSCKEYMKCYGADDEDSWLRTTPPAIDEETTPDPNAAMTLKEERHLIIFLRAVCLSVCLHAIGATGI